MAGFGAKVKLTVDRSSKAEFNKQINDLVGQIKISNKFTVLQKDMDRVRKEAQAMLNSNPMILKVNKIDCSAAVTNVKNQLQSMLSALSVSNGVNITGLKDFLGAEGVDATMRNTADAANAAVQKMNEAKMAAAAWTGQMGVLDSVVKGLASTYKSGISGSNMIADESEVQRITTAYNQWLQKVQEIRAARSGDVEALQQEGLALQRNITAIQNKQTEEARAAAAAERAARAAEDAAARGEQANESEIASLKQIASLQERMTRFLRSNSKLSYSDAGSSIRKMLKDLRSGTEITTDRLKEMEDQFARIRTEAAKSGSLGRSLLDSLSNAYGKFGGWMLITRSLTAAARSIRAMISNVTELDSALAQLKIVTGATDAQISSFLTTATVLAKDLGKSITDVLGSIETFSRLGYNLQDATTLSKYANILANVAAVDTEAATTGMTSIIKGYNLDVKKAEHVADVLVEVGQKYAVSAGEMMEAYEKSGAALNATNTSFEKSAGLIAAANAAVQNASTVGTALKTISARIRGSKSDLEELGEDTADLAEGFSKYAKEIEALTGFNIMVSGKENTFKDIYDIFEGISKVWGSLSDTQQARISEILGGTRQLQVVSSILANWSDAAGAYADAMDSAGVATEANAIYMDTISAKVGQFKAAFQSLSQAVFSSDVLAGFVDLGTSIINAVGAVVRLSNVLGGLNTALLVTLGIITTIKFQAIRDYVKDIGSSISKFGKNITAFWQLFIEGFTASKAAGVGTLSAISAGFQGVAGSAVMSQLAVAGVFAAITVGVIAYRHFHKTTEELVASSNRAKDSFKEFKEQIEDNVGTLNSLSDEFKRLSQGVDTYGHNISLSADDYERYKEIVQQIVGISPELVEGYDKENGYLADKNRLLERAIELQELEYQNELRRRATTPYITDAVAGSVATYSDIMSGEFYSAGTALKDSIWNMFNDIPDDINGGEFLARQIMRALGVDNIDKEIQKYFNEHDVFQTNLFWNDYLDRVADDIESANSHLISSIDFEEAGFKSRDDFQFAIDELKSAVTEYLDVRENLNAANQDVSNQLKVIAESNSRYSELSEDAKHIIENFVNSFGVEDITKNGFFGGKVIDERAISNVRTQINDFIAKLTPEVQKIADKGFNLKLGFDINGNELSVEEYRKQIYDFLHSVSQIKDEDLQLYIKMTLGMDVDSTELDSDVEKAIAHVMNLIKESEPQQSINDFLNGMSVSDAIAIYYNISASPNSMTIDELQTEIDKIHGKTAEALSDGLGDLLETLDKLEARYKLLATLQSEMKENGKVSSGTLSSLKEQYESMDDIIALYKIGLATAQDVYNEYAKLYEADEARFIEANKWKIITSEEYFNQNIKGNKEWIEIIGEYYATDYKNFSELAKKKLEIDTLLIQKLGSNWQKYYASYASAIRNSYAMLDSQGDFDRSKNSGGMTQYNTYQDYVDAETKRQYNTWSTEQKQAYDSAMALAKMMDSISNKMENLDLDLSLDAGSSSGSKSSKKAIEEYIADIDQYREAQERLRKIKESISGLERQINDMDHVHIVSTGELEELEAVNAQLNKRNELLETTLGSIEYYKSVQDDIAKMDIDPSESVFGNIDLNNRQVIQWTDEMISKYRSAIESWGASIEEFRGTTSTVLGGLDEFRGVPIAFSPMLQTEDGAVLLDSNTVYNYIEELVNRVGDNWHTEDLLRLDADGLELDGRIIKNLIADIGDTAEHTSESMHFLGTDGAIADSYREISASASLFGVTIEELVDQYDSLNQEYEQNEAAIEANSNSIQSAFTSEFNVAMARIGLQKQMINAYQQEQAALLELNRQRSVTITDNVKKLQSLGFTATYNAESNELWINNLEHLNELTAKSKGKYDSVQEATNALRKDTEELIKSMESLNEENREGTTTWLDLRDSIRSAKIAVVDDLKQIVTDASDSVDEIQNVYDTLKSAADEYAENGGFISVDAFQSIIKLGPQYMQYLEDENGLLVINEENINKVIAAKTRQLAAEQALTYVERLKLATQPDSIENLNELLYATTSATDATFGLAYAELELMRAMGDLDEDQYAAARHNIESIESLANTAVASIGKVSGEYNKTLKEELDNMKSGIDDILKYVMDMLKHRIQQQIDALEYLKDAYGDIIDLRKEALDAAKKEAEYEDKVSEKVKQIAKLQERINALSLDDSRDAQAQKIKLEEEMAEIQKELADDQSDYAVDSQKEALDDMKEAYEREKDGEIAALEETISSYQKLYDMAIEYIENHWNTLYDELISWNTEYGNVLNSEITEAWNNCLAAAQRYGSYVSALNNIDADISAIGSSSNSTVGSNKVVGSTSKPSSSTKEEEVHSIIKRMYSNMNEHGGSHSSTSAERKAQLSQENLRLGAQLKQYGINAYRSTDKADLGTWYTDSSKKELLFDKYRKYIYHMGGVAGDNPSLKQNEIMAVLEKGEFVLDTQKEKGLYRLIDFTTALSEKLGRALGSIDLSGILDVTKNGIESMHAPLPGVTNNQNEAIHFGDVYIYGGNEATVKQHQEINRQFTNEVLSYLRIKR